MRTASCASCGAVLAGRTRRARFCDARCRVRYARGSRPAPTEPDPAPRAPTAPLPAADDLAVVESWDDVAAMLDLPSSVSCERRRQSRDW